MSRRDALRAQAEDNLRIFSDGLYEAADGTVVLVADGIARSVAGTVRLAEAPSAPVPAAAPARVTLANETTLAGAARVAAGGAEHIAVLNFASARSPGGGFLRGGMAQEEALCHATTLYPALHAQPDFYAANKAWPDAVYADDLLYTPDVAVIRDDHGHLVADPQIIAVITAPAPNRAALGGERRLLAMADAALARRAGLILSTAARFGHRDLVLGAWGCGVFANPPGQVARIFAEALSGPFHGAFDRVHFAVLDREECRNGEAFAQALAGLTG